MQPYPFAIYPNDKLRYVVLIFLSTNSWIKLRRLIIKK